jgi:hypothetical protein
MRTKNINELLPPWRMHGENKLLHDFACGMSAIMKANAKACHPTGDGKSLDAMGTAVS